MMNFRIRALLGWILLLYAPSSFSNHPVFSGFYTGFGLGGSFFSGQENNSVTVGSSNTFSQQNAIRKNAFMSSLYLGYGSPVYWESTYFATEAFIDFADRESETFKFSGDTLAPFALATQNRIKMNNVSFGFDFRPGFRVGECQLFYARLGFGYNRINFSSFSAETNSTTLLFISKSIDRAVFRMGLGMEYALSECLTLRADYIYSNFGKFSFSGLSSAAGVTMQGNTQYYLVNHSVLLGLSWYW